MITPPPPSKTIRLTVPVTPEVHAAFDRLARATGRPLGRCMADWMADTLEAVEFMAVKMEQARVAPKLVMREMHAYALGLADQTSEILDTMKGPRGARLAESASAPAAQPSAPTPPRPVIRGGNLLKGHK